MIRRWGLLLAGMCLAAGCYWLWRSDQNASDCPVRTASESGTVSAQLLSPEGTKITRSTRPRERLRAVKNSSAPTLRKRPWNPTFLASLNPLNFGDPIELELVAGESASGHVRYIRRTKEQLVYISGDLIGPESGQFFFQKQTMPGVAGQFVGVITFPASERAYRIEPTGPDGAPELIERPLSEVMCGGLPRPADSNTNQTAEIPPLKPGNFPDLPIPGYQNGIVVLESLHGATPVVYLDFQGGYTEAWGGVAYDRPNVSNPQIRDVWVRVAEDFMPFNINVTTDLAVYQSAPEGSRQHVIITPTTTVAGEAGGVAMIGSFNWTGDMPCWVFTLSGKGCAEACSHEVGHTLGLLHEGQQIGGQLFDYYTGHGTGDTSWAPIMGLPYYANVTQWCKGEYTNADNLVDELAFITTQNNNVSYRPDDTGDTLATSRYLELYTDYSAFAEGVIEHTDDTDAFQFTTSGGEASLRADPVSASPDLAIQVSIFDAGDRLVASSDPQDTLWASLTTNLSAGTYTFRVGGAGRNDPLTNGFSSYASLGYYSITGSVANARLPNRFSILEHAANGTVVGIIPVLNTNQDPLRFDIVSGNPGDTFSIDASGTLLVAKNSLLDYDRLASTTQLAVQFELLVNIADLLNPALTETRRRVVVAVTYVPTPPSTRQRPGYLSAPAGTNVAFSISAIGDWPLSYQWLFNGSPIAGASTSALSLTNIQAHDTASYTVVVTNKLGSITNLVAQLVVTPALPVIMRQPQVQAVSLHFPASFSVAAVGSEPFTYQWQHNGSNIPGATGPELLIRDVRPSLAGRYVGVVSNNVGSASSSEALLTIVPVAAWGWNGDGQTNLFPDLTNAVQVSAGPSYNLALRRDGSIFTWGATDQVGLPPDLTNAVAVAAGGAHGLALTSAGTVVAWGANNSGQASVPAGLNNVVAIAAGAGHSLALRSNGRVVGWGLNSSGQATVPSFAVLTNVIAVAAGSNHSLALGADGRVVAWGNNSFGQARIPTNATAVVSIAAGAWHSLALKSDGTVAAWGLNTNGQCAVPRGLSNVVAIAAGSFHSLALTSSGAIVAWGAGLTNALKFPELGQSIVPAPAANGGASGIAGGAAHTLALLSGDAPFIVQSPVGSLAYGGQQIIFRVVATGALPLSYQWQLNGTNLPGQTHQVLLLPSILASDAGGYRVMVSNVFGTITSATATITVLDVAPVIAIQPADQQVFLGGKVNLQVSAYGSQPLYYQWRFNGVDILGAKRSAYAFQQARWDQSGYYSVLVSNAFGVINSAKAKVSVQQVVAWGAGTNYSGFANYGQSIVPPDLFGVVSVAGGTYHSLALRADGLVEAWGAGTNVGIGFNDGQAEVPGLLTNATAIAAGLYHSLALTADGNVLAWGAATSGSSSPQGQTLVPVGLSDVVAIAAGNFHSVALHRDGALTVWASSSFSQTNPPFSGLNVVSVSSRGNQIMALRGDGSVVRWGSFTGVPQSLSDVVAIAAGDSHCLALKADSTVVAWDSGFTVPPGLSNVVQIAAGSGFSMALRNDGTLVVWGESAPPFGVWRLPVGLTNVVSIGCGDYHALAILGDGSPFMTTQPISHLANVGDKTFLRAVALGARPLRYQWRFNGADIPGATSFLLRFASLQTTNSGDYCLVASNVYGSITSKVATLTAVLSLAQTLGGPNLFWNTSGSAPWTSQTDVTFNSLPTAQSGHIGDNQQSSLQTSVNGPGTLTFWWKVSSEQYYDFLNFYMDGNLQAAISGEVDWQLVTIPVPGGIHTLQWSYQKDPSVSVGLDAAWLAQVLYTPDMPLILTQPVSQTVSMGDTVTLTATALGRLPLRYQWFKDGVFLDGAASTSLIITNATRSNSGSYQMSAANSAGKALSIFALVKVRVPQKLGIPSVLADGTLAITSSDADGGSIGTQDLPNFQGQVSTNLLDWVPLGGSSLGLTNGSLLLLDPGATTNNPAHFYRIIEQ